MNDFFEKSGCVIKYSEDFRPFEISFNDYFNNRPIESYEPIMIFGLSVSNKLISTLYEFSVKPDSPGRKYLIDGFLVKEEKKYYSLKLYDLIFDLGFLDEIIEFHNEKVERVYIEYNSVLTRIHEQDQKTNLLDF